MSGALLVVLDAEITPVDFWLGDPVAWEEKRPSFFSWSPSPRKSGLVMGLVDQARAETLVGPLPTGSMWAWP